MWLIRVLAKMCKPILRRTLYRPGRVAKILFGPSKGLRYRIFPEFGLAHLYGAWEPYVHRSILEHVRAGSVVYDLGANYGLHTLLFAKLAGSTGCVFAFEPMPRIREALVENIALNGFANVVVSSMAISDRVGNEQYVIGEHDGAGHIKSGGRGDSSPVKVEQTFTVSVTTIDQFVRDGNAPPTFVKIDVEGSEGAVLRGATDVILKYRPILLIELHTPEQDVLVGQELLSHRYSAIRVETGELVRNLTVGWPDPYGIWGMVLATPMRD